MVDEGTGPVFFQDGIPVTTRPYRRRNRSPKTTGETDGECGIPYD